MKLKVLIISMTIQHLYSSYSKRIKRLFYHITFRTSLIKIESNGIVEWITDLLFYILDLFLIPEVYESVTLLTKSKYRPLSSVEKSLATRYFGNSINLNHVRINSQMSKRIQNYAHAYVTINTINYYQTIPNAIFIHELVHVWQYQRYGSMYIHRSLKAQNSKEKYDYGGLERLYNGLISQKKLITFNFEQQASIIEDYCRLNEQADGFNSPIVNASYEYYVTQLEYRD